MSDPKRKVNDELTELRTVLSRAKTAVNAISNIQRSRRVGSPYFEHFNGKAAPTDVEVDTMRSALMAAICVLDLAEKKCGHEVS